MYIYIYLQPILRVLKYQQQKDHKGRNPRMCRSPASVQISPLLLPWLQSPAVHGNVIEQGKKVKTHLGIPIPN